jgi:23S rRNA (cytidine1920-2'-O)/16S rRNA (cytidine1409-2'-O)-methyltransferase
VTERLDAALAARGLARSRTHAASLIAGGVVKVDGVEVRKPATRVRPDADIHIAATDHYVSRAAHKLIAALDAFDVPVAGRAALDMGASTGGFTQVLRERGADPVLAVDVGHGQLDPLLATDPHVIAVEGLNVRHLSPSLVANILPGDRPLSVITGDLSFISLVLVLPAVASIAALGTDIVLLVKPQFEVGRSGVKEGLVTDPAARADAVAAVLWAGWDLGLGTRGVIASPLRGTRGNAEFLVHLKPAGGDNPSEWLGTVNQVAGET